VTPIFRRNVLSSLPGQTTQADMQTLVNQKINDWNETNNQAYLANQCAMEWAAFQAEYSVAPHYMEWKQADVAASYGCSF
jgi:hypothetical protein